MIDIRTTFNSAFVVLLLSACAEKEEDIDHALESDLTGVWQIEHIHSNALTQEFTNTYYNVEIHDDGENVDINHCLNSENMYFERGDHLLTNSNGEQLHIIDATLIGSVSVPNVVKLTKTSKSNMLDAGTINLSSDRLGQVQASANVCAQRITTSRDLPNNYHFHFSLPFNSSFIEIDLHYSESIDGDLENIEKLSFYSPVFTNHGFPTRTVETLFGEIKVVSLTDSSANFSFDITTVTNSVFPDEHITGEISVNY